MGSSKRIASGFIWTTLQTIINGVYGFVSVPLLLAHFGKANYALIGLAMSINVYLGMMDLGFNNTSVRYFANWCAKKNFDLVKKLFSTNLIFYGSLGFVNSLVLLVVSCFSLQIFDVSAEQDIVLKHLFYILSISAFIGWYTSVFNQILQGNEYVGWVQRFVFIPKCVQILVLVLTLTSNFSIELYYGLTVFSAFLTMPIVIWKIKKVCPYISFKPSFDKAIFKEMLPYSLQVFSFGFFQFSANYLRPVILGIRGNIESVADFRIVNGIVGIVIMLGGMFIGIIMPSASKVVAMNNLEAQDRIAYQGTKFLSIFLCLVSFGMMSISRDLLLAYVGPAYLHLLVWLNLWLIMTAVGSHIQCMSSLILSGTKISGVTIPTITAAVVTIVACWILTPFFQVGGAIIAYSLFSLILVGYYYLYYYQKKMHKDSWRLFSKSFLPSFLLGFALSLICINLPIDLGKWGTLICKGLIFAVAYLSLSYLYLNNDERSFLFNLIKRK